MQLNASSSTTYPGSLNQCPKSSGKTSAQSRVAARSATSTLRYNQFPNPLCNTGRTQHSDPSDVWFSTVASVLLLGGRRFEARDRPKNQPNGIRNSLVCEEGSGGGDSPLTSRKTMFLHVTYKSQTSLSPSAHASLRRSLARNPSLTLRFWNDSEAQTLVSTECAARVRGVQVAHAYARLVPAVARADLFRYCVLLVKGGVYLDADAELLKPIDELYPVNGLGPVNGLVVARESAWWPGSDAAHVVPHLRASQRAVLADHNDTHPRYKIGNWLLLASANAFTLRHVVVGVAHNVLAWRETAATRRICLRGRVLWTTGPSALTLLLTPVPHDVRVVADADFGPMARRKAVPNYGAHQRRGNYWCKDQPLTK